MLSCGVSIQSERLSDEVRDCPIVITKILVSRYKRSIPSFGHSFIHSFTEQLSGSAVVISSSPCFVSHGLFLNETKEVVVP